MIVHDPLRATRGMHMVKSYDYVYANKIDIVSILGKALSATAQAVQAPVVSATEAQPVARSVHEPFGMYD